MTEAFLSILGKTQATACIDEAQATFQSSRLQAGSRDRLDSIVTFTPDQIVESLLRAIRACKVLGAPLSKKKEDLQSNLSIVQFFTPDYTSKERENNEEEMRRLLLQEPADSNPKKKPSTILDRSGCCTEIEHMLEAIANFRAFFLPYVEELEQSELWKRFEKIDTLFNLPAGREWQQRWGQMPKIVIQLICELQDTFAVFARIPMNPLYFQAAKAGQEISVEPYQLAIRTAQATLGRMELAVETCSTRGYGGEEYPEAARWLPNFASRGFPKEPEPAASRRRLNDGTAAEQQSRNNGGNGNGGRNSGGGNGQQQQQHQRGGGNNNGNNGQRGNGNGGGETGPEGAGFLVWTQGMRPQNSAVTWREGTETTPMRLCSYFASRGWTCNRSPCNQRHVPPSRLNRLSAENKEKIRSWVDSTDGLSLAPGIDLSE